MEKKGEIIRIKKLLDKYLEWMKKGEVHFLKGKKNLSHKIKIRSLIIKLQETLPEEGDKSQLDWYEAHKIGRELWEELASAALNNIDKDSKGNKKLFEYLEKATIFEDILYGLDEYYRDHTLHSLWVYFIGEDILRSSKLDELQENLNWYLYNDIEAYKDIYSYPPDLVDFSIDKKEKLEKKVHKYKDAVWCIIALCHDLGYSLAKLSELNEKVKDVIDFFDIPDIRRVGYFLDVEHQHLVSQFLELMSMDVRIVPSENYEEVKDKAEDLGIKKIDVKSKSKNQRKYKKELEERTLIKCYRDDAAYWSICRALEKKKHGILGAYLIYKMLGIFADTSVRGPAEEWGLEDDEVVANIIRGDILHAIAQHDFDFAHLHNFNSLADVLVLADELEEFSRFGRQLLSRKYHNTMANARVDFNVISSKSEGKNEKGIKIDIEYTVDEEHDMGEFFLRKAKSLCQFYSLDPEEKERDRRICSPKYYEIQSINMKVKQKSGKGYRDLVLEFNLSKDSNHKFKLQSKSTGKPIEKTLECQDDTLRTKDSKHIQLSEIFKDYGKRDEKERLVGWHRKKKKKRRK